MAFVCTVPGCVEECRVCGGGDHTGWLKCRCSAHARTKSSWVCESPACLYENVLSAEVCVACGADHPPIPESVYAPPPPPPMPGVNVDEVLPPVADLPEFGDVVERDVEIVMAQTGVQDRAAVIAALERNAGDIVNTIMEVMP